jgi:hypothetical protein
MDSSNLHPDRHGEEPWRRYVRSASVSTDGQSTVAESVADKSDKDAGFNDVGLQSPPAAKLLFGEDGQAGGQRSLFKWTGEVLSLLLGVVMLISACHLPPPASRVTAANQSHAVIISVLAAADGRSPPQWPLGITLNTLLAFLAAVSKIAFMVPIAAGLGQLKWMWFSAGPARPLSDFEAFDDASRGAWGSVKLIIHNKGYVAPTDSRDDWR